MALELARVHVYARHRDPTTGEVSQRLVDFNPYLSLKSGDDPAVFIQRGKLYSAEGPELAPDEVPAWFADELAKCTPDSLRAVGWLTDEDAVPPVPAWVPPPHEDHRNALLESLAQLPNDVLEQLVQHGQTGTPQTPVYDLDPADFPEDQLEDLTVPNAWGGDPVSLVPPIPEDPAQENEWTCEKCGETMDLREKGLHIGRYHRKARVAQEE